MNDVTQVLDALAGHTLHWRVWKGPLSAEHVVKSYDTNQPHQYLLKIEVSVSSERILEETGLDMGGYIKHVERLSDFREVWDLLVPANTSEQARAWLTSKLGPSHE